MKNKRFKNKINNCHIKKCRHSNCIKCHTIVTRKKHKKHVLKRSSNDEIIQLIEIYNQNEQGDDDSE